MKLPAHLGSGENCPTCLHPLDKPGPPHCGDDTSHATTAQARAIARLEKPGRGGARIGAGRELGTGKGRTGKGVSVSFPADLLRDIDRAADRAGVSRSAWLVDVAQASFRK